MQKQKVKQGIQEGSLTDFITKKAFKTVKKELMTKKLYKDWVKVRVLMLNGKNLDLRVYKPKDGTLTFSATDRRLPEKHQTIILGLDKKETKALKKFIKRGLF
jgi:hypothetical protein